ncbi:MAG: SelB C-terminal domain-containing protein, partial [Acidimicrobiia bacterium]|nr:SelB C-terminal domain-containing protein [Acidimicrobiia bacterium]
ETGRQSVVAGGQILDPGADPRPSRARPHLGVLEGLTAGTPDEVATSLLALRRVASKSLLQRWTRGGQPHAALEAGDVVMSAPAVEASLANAIEEVEAFHSAQPLRPGIPKASLASRLSVDLATLDALLPKTPRLRDDGSTVALAGFHAGLTAAQEGLWQETAATLAGAGLGVPRLAELDLGREMLHVLLREGRLVRVSDDLVYLPDQLADLQDRLASLPSPFTVADFRDAFDISRKYAVPLLEWLDARGVTARSGDTRLVRQGKGRPEGRP